MSVARIEVEAVGINGKKGTSKITELNEQFIQCYLFDEQFAGNGTQCYCKVYELDPKIKKEYDNARTRASELLKKDAIISRIAYVVQETTLSISQAYYNLAWLAKQRHNLTVALNANKAIIDEHHRLTDISESRGMKQGNKPVIKQIKVSGIPSREKEIEEAEIVG